MIRNPLSMRLLRRATLILSLILVLLAPSFAGVEVVEIATVQFTNTLAGVVDDPSDAPLANAQVVEVTSDWHTRVRSTMTDKDDRWSLPPVPKQEMYYLRFVTKQCCFDEIRCRVKLGKRKGKDLRISLPLST